MSGCYRKQMTVSRANQGPRAAAGNRRALLDAARELFDQRGIDLPLVEVARAAGVGQGVLYRHFPDRLALVFAVFEENMERLEAHAAASPMTVRDLAFEVASGTSGIAPMLSLVTQAADDPRLIALEERTRALLTDARERDLASGRLRPDLTVEDLLAAMSMIAALTASTPPALRQSRVEHAWALLEKGVYVR